MKLTGRFALIVAAAVCLLVGSIKTMAQREGQGPTSGQEPIARRADLYCTGFISELPPRVDLQLIGGEKENQKDLFSQGDIVYLNKGRDAGVQSGAVYYIIRPAGKFTHPFTRKSMGYYVKELGMLRVIEVQDKTATAQITISCDLITFGDPVRLYEEVPSPQQSGWQPLPRYSEGTNGTRGQLIMSPNQHEYLSANQIVYIDLGYRQGVRPGDHFTIYRTIGKTEGPTQYKDDNVSTNMNSDFGSKRYRGGEYSLEGAYQTHEEVLSTRPKLPRKVLGELVVVKVDNSTAVAKIIRTTAEVNIGDLIELMK